jgi:hypothetical protein
MSTKPNGMQQALENVTAISINGDRIAVAPAPQPQFVPLPPNLHWSIALIFFLFGGQLLVPLWALVQANWARKLSGEKKPLVLVAMYPAGLIVMFLILASVFYATLRNVSALGMNVNVAILFAPFVFFAGIIAYIIGLFSIKLAMEEYYNSTEDIGLQMSGAMTFFFHVIYIQYHINHLPRRS